jgi:hypothetical protein
MDREQLLKHRTRMLFRFKLRFTATMFAVLGGISVIPATLVGRMIAPTFDYLFVVVFLLTLLAGIMLLMFLLLLSIDVVYYWYPEVRERELGFVDPNAKPTRPSIVAALRQTVDFILLKHP